MYKNSEEKVYNMLDKITKEEAKIIIQSYQREIEAFACQNQHYVEACGLYCPETSKWSIDMSGKLNSCCTKDCPKYVQTGTQKRAEQMLALFDQIKVDTIDQILQYIEENPTSNNSDIIMMLMNEREISYVKEATDEVC